MSIHLKARFAAAALVALLALALGGCSLPGSHPKAAASSGEPTVAPSSVPAQAVDCTPTQPDGQAPPGEPASEYYLGNGKLTTVLWPKGEIVFESGGPGQLRADGSLAMKFPFWRAAGVKGGIVIEGYSLDRPGLTMTGEVPPGYGDRGFQATVLVFPEPGCWEVTARVGDSTLTFVTGVVRRQ
jgi:hypothetical protein